MAVNFNRLLCLLSNEVMVKSRDVVGSQVLSNPELVSVCSVCACMRMYVHGNYADMFLVHARCGDGNAPVAKLEVGWV